MIRALRGSTPGVLLTRVAIAAIVVFSTYNPSGTSISHWIAASPNPWDAWVVLVGIVTALANLALLLAAWKALGLIGTLIVAILFGAIVYLALQEGWVDSGSTESIAWLALILVSVFFGIGLAGAIVWRRATGQVITDEAPDLER